MTEKQIVDAISQEYQFRTFGGGRGSYTNPIAAALKDEPLCFAAGVDVAEIVRFVLQHAKK